MPVRPEKQTLYTKVWSGLYDEYSCGFLVSERGLQAELYAKLRMEIPHARIIVEPTWETIGGKTCRPDLVVVEGGRITDVFELKFAPHYYPRWKDDVAKLRRYVAESGKYPVSLDKTTGHWVNYLSVWRPRAAASSCSSGPNTLRTRLIVAPLRRHSDRLKD